MDRFTEMYDDRNIVGIYFFSWLYITPVGKWYFIFTYNSCRTLKSFTKEEVRIFCKKEYFTITVVVEIT